MNLRFSRHVELREKKVVHLAKYRNFHNFLPARDLIGQLITGHVIQFV